MGRPAEGWKLKWHGRLAYVRFSYVDPLTGKTLRPELPTGESDPRRAASEGARIYADVIAGRIPVTPSARVSTSPLLDLADAWLHDLAKTYPANTCKCYGEYASKWLRRWKTLGEITEQAVAEYARDGLTRATRSTIRKELAALLGNFFGWLIEKQHVAVAPPRPVALLRKSPGKRTGTQRVNRVEITPEEVRRFLAAVPEFGGKADRRWRARDAVLVMYETGLRPITVARLSVPDNFTPGAATLEIDDAIDKARFGRSLPLTKAAQKALERCAPKSGVIFGQHDYRDVFATATLAAGTPKGFSPYDIRHARLQHLVDAGAPLPGVAFLAGHKRLTTTNTYVRAARNQAERALSFGEIVGKPVSGKKERSKRSEKTSGAKEGT